MKTFVRSFSYLLALFYLSSFCHATIYAKFTGTVPTPGDSQADGRRDWVEISAFSAGIEVDVTIGGGGGGTVSRASFNALSLSKVVDSASIGLMSSGVSGTPYSEVIIEVTKNGPAGELVMLRIEMKNVYVGKVAMSHSDGSGEVDESVELKYEAHKITTYAIDPNTGALRLSGVHQWNIVTNTPNY